MHWLSGLTAQRMVAPAIQRRTVRMDPAVASVGRLGALCAGRVAKITISCRCSSPCGRGTDTAFRGPWTMRRSQLLPRTSHRSCRPMRSSKDQNVIFQICATGCLWSDYSGAGPEGRVRLMERLAGADEQPEEIAQISVEGGNASPR